MTKKTKQPKQLVKSSKTLEERMKDGEFPFLRSLQKRFGIIKPDEDNNTNQTTENDHEKD